MDLIIGRAGTGKTTEILDRVRKDIERNENVYLIVPEQFSYAFEKKITDSFSSVFNLQILSFSRLVEQTLNDSKYKNKIYLDDISRTIVLETILEKLDLVVLKNKEKNIKAVSNIIEEFKKYNINLSALKQFIDLEKKKGITKSILKLEEIYNIYEKYNEEIENKYLDIADKEYEALEIMDEGFKFKGFKIYIDQFSKFTEGEYKIIEMMLKQAKSVNIAITADSIYKKSEYEIFSSTKDTISNLIQLAKMQNIEVKIVEKLVNIKHGEEIKKLEQSMFEETEVLSTKSGQLQGNITLKVYKNIEEELDELAENIMQEVIEKEYSFNEIAVVFNNIDAQENLVRRAFDKYNIPISLPIEKKLEQNSMARYILDLVEIISSKYSMSSVFSFLKLGYTNFSLNDIYLLEKYVLRWNVRGSKWKSEWKNYDNLPDEEFKRILHLKEDFVNFVEDFKKEIGRSKSAKDISFAIYSLLEEENIFEKSIKGIDKLEIDNSKKLELKSEYTSSLSLIQETLDRIVSIKSDSIISYEKYFNILSLVLKETVIKQIPSINDAIHIITTKTLNLDNIKSLYIVSLEDGLYPLIPSYVGLISDEEKLYLRANNIKISETDIEKLADDDFNMYSVFLIPSTSLHLSYHISDLEGGSKRASIYINKIKKRLKYLEEENRISGLFKEELRFYSNKSLFDKVLSKYLELLDGKEIEDEWKYLIYTLQETSSEFRIIEKNILNKNIAPNLSLDIVENLYKNDLFTSVSKLEEYAKCPFAYYTKYILKIKESDKYEINPLNTGTLFHSVLEEFVKLIQSGEFSLDEMNSKIGFLPEKETYLLKQENKEFRDEYDKIMKNIEDITTDILNKKLQEDSYKIFNLSPKFQIYTNKFQEQIKETTKALVNTLRLSDFKVLGNEIKIDSTYSKSEYKLSNNKKIKFFGSIDRADILEQEDKTYVRIVDYKSSSFPLDENKVRAGLQIQLLTYLDILAKEKNFEPSALLYFVLNSRIKNIGEKTESDIAKALKTNNKMEGILLADEGIVRSMDKSLIFGRSEILPVGIKAKGDFYTGSKVKDKEEFEELRETVGDVIVSMSENIMQGNISINPYKYREDTGCRYCPYIKICHFDPKKNQYRIIKSTKKKDKVKKDKV